MLAHDVSVAQELLGTAFVNFWRLFWSVSGRFLPTLFWRGSEKLFIDRGGQRGVLTLFLTVGGVAK